MASKTTRSAPYSRVLLLELAAHLSIRSHRQLARQLGVTPQSISLLMKGKRTMSAETAMTICRLLHKDLSDCLTRLAAERNARRKPQAPKFASAKEGRELRAIMHSDPERPRSRAYQRPLI